MKVRLGLLLAALFGVWMVVPSAVRAQDSQGANPAVVPLSQEELSFLKEKLELNDEQTEKIGKLLAGFRAKRKEIRIENDKKMGKGSKNAMKTQIQQLWRETEMVASKILTGEQMAKFRPALREFQDQQRQAKPKKDASATPKETTR